MKRSKFTRPAWLGEQGEGGQGTADKPRLRTSAMIASLAVDGATDDRGAVRPCARPPRPGATRHHRHDGRSRGSTPTCTSSQRSPPRPLLYQMGMAEQLLMGAAAGMAREGFTPFVTTYAAFAARRTYDFVAMGIAEDQLPVKLICALPGLTTGYGPSHQATDDIAIFRAMPNLAIVDPCDAVDIEQAVPAIAAHPGPVYMRLLRGNVPKVLDAFDYRFELGRAALLRDGSDGVLIAATGLMTMRALVAAEQLSRPTGSMSAVLHVPTIKPLDETAIAAAFARPGRLCVVAENHSVVGGLGEAVAGALARGPARAGAVPDDRAARCVPGCRGPADAA